MKYDDGECRGRAHDGERCRPHDEETSEQWAASSASDIRGMTHPSGFVTELTDL